MTAPGRLSRDRIAQLPGEQVLACTHRLSIRSSRALFKPGDWHLKRLLILCFFSSDKCSHLIGHFPPAPSIFEQVFNTDLKRNCDLTYYCVSHSGSSLNSGAWLTQRLIAAVVVTAHSHLLDSAGTDLSSYLGSTRDLDKRVTGSSRLDTQTILGLMLIFEI